MLSDSTLQFGLAYIPLTEEDETHVVEETDEDDFLEDPNFIPPSPPESIIASLPSTPRGGRSDCSDNEDLKFVKRSPRPHKMKLEPAAPKRAVRSERSLGKDQSPRDLPPVPATLDECFALLKRHAHVNLMDWIETRQEVEAIVAGKEALGQRSLTTREKEDLHERLRSLVFPTATAMIE